MNRQVGRQDRLGQQVRHRRPARRLVRAGRFDVAGDHVAAEAVIDDIGAILVGEGERLVGAVARDKLVALGELDRLGAADPAFQIDRARS